MPMSRRDRFKLKIQVTERLGSTDWSWTAVDLLFRELEMAGIEDFTSPDEAIAAALADISDSKLIEFYAIVFDLDEREVAGSVESINGEGIWKQGLVRVFLSHSSTHKVFVREVSDELAVLGIHGFVAHEAIEVTTEWQDSIEDALRSMQAFVAIGHQDFLDSSWCQQELGWALGRRTPFYVLRAGMDEGRMGFVQKYQWPVAGTNPERLAHEIYAWVARQPELGAAIIDGVLRALADANDYISAGAAAQRIAAIGRFTPADFLRLNEVYWGNDQAWGGGLTRKALEPFYLGNKTPWPPPKPH